MSKAHLDQFMNKAASSVELQLKIDAATDTEALIALGAEHGCSFTAADLEASTELDDEALESVAGGVDLFRRALAGSLSGGGALQGISKRDLGSGAVSHSVD